VRKNKAKRIIDNFIIFYTSDEDTRRQMRNSLQDYLEEEKGRYD
jgi:hypothetical protein